MITKKHVTLEWKPVIMWGHWLNDNDNHDNKFPLYNWSQCRKWMITIITIIKFLPRRVLPPRRTPLCRCEPLRQAAMIVAATKAQCHRCRWSSSSLIQDDHHRHYHHWIELGWIELKWIELNCDADQSRSRRRRLMQCLQNQGSRMRSPLKKIELIKLARLIRMIKIDQVW